MFNIPLTKENLNIYYDGNIKPVLKVKSGEIVSFECIDCYNGQIKDEKTLFKDIDTTLNNPVTGPLYIEDCKAEDVIKIDILDVEINDRAVMAVRPYQGVYTSVVNKYVSKIVEIKGCYAYFNTDQGELKIKISPFIGDIGLVGKKPYISTIPTINGGNFDCKEIKKGSVLYLPAAVDGGLLSMGDLHAGQGDGETAICALEVSGKVTVKVNTVKNLKINYPLLITDDSYIVLASDRNLDIAAETACLDMHNFITRFGRISTEDTAMLLSIGGDLRVAQIVNDIKTCYFVFSRSILDLKDFCF